MEDIFWEMYISILESVYCFIYFVLKKSSNKLNVFIVNEEVK